MLLNHLAIPCNSSPHILLRSSHSGSGRLECGQRPPDRECWDGLIRQYSGGVPQGGLMSPQLNSNHAIHPLN